MPGDAFRQALEFTVCQEGGWSDNPADPGGTTMQGITLAVFRAWRHDLSARPDQLHAITAREVEAIYRALYWNPIRGASLPLGISLSVFDAAVNLGVRRAAMLLQAALDVAQDGAIGPITLDVARRVAPGTLLSRLAVERETFYRKCMNFSLFGRGWLKRNRECLFAALQTAGLLAERVPAPSMTIASEPRAPTADELNTAQLKQLRAMSGNLDA